MKNYLVKASYVVYVEADIQAESQEKAWNKAIQMDGADFIPEGESDFKVDAIIELENS